MRQIKKMAAEMFGKKARKWNSQKCTLWITLWLEVQEMRVKDRNVA